MHWTASKQYKWTNFRYHTKESIQLIHAHAYYASHSHSNSHKQWHSPCTMQSVASGKGNQRRPNLAISEIHLWRKDVPFTNSETQTLFFNHLPHWQWISCVGLQERCSWRGPCQSLPAHLSWPHTKVASRHPRNLNHTMTLNMFECSQSCINRKLPGQQTVPLPELVPGFLESGSFSHRWLICLILVHNNKAFHGSAEERQLDFPGCWKGCPQTQKNSVLCNHNCRRLKTCSRPYKLGW